MPEHDPAYQRLLACLLARHRPADAVERHEVEEIAHAMWRQQRLRRIEAQALERAERGTDEPEAAHRPSLAVLARCRAQVERGLRAAAARLAAACAARPCLPAALGGMDALRLRWLADRVQAQADAGTSGPKAAQTRLAAM